MKLERTTEAPAPVWNPIATVAAIALAVGGIAMLVSMFDTWTAAAAEWTPDRDDAIVRALAGFAAGAVVGACALVALAAALPRRTGRAGAIVAAVLVGPGAIGVAGAFASARFLASDHGGEQLVGVLGLLAASLLCGCSLIGVALHYGRRR